jgi:tRNA pseudouridine38-40 synthase
VIKNLQGVLDVIYRYLTHEDEIPPLRNFYPKEILSRNPSSSSSSFALWTTDVGQMGEMRRSKFEPETVMRALNFWLGQAGAPVSVLSAEIVSDDWHARFSCRRRNYKYIIVNRKNPVVLDKSKVWWIPRDLDMEKMRAAARKLLGEHDWTSFRASECQAKSPIKTLDKIRISNLESRISIEFSARSFLHHQVRNIVGTLVEIGLDKPLDIDEIFVAKNRSAAGPTAPACGLYFVSAEY